MAAGPAGTSAGWHLQRGFPPGPGRGSRLSLEKARTQRVAGGCPPPPLGLGAAHCRSLVLAWWGAAGRSLGYFVTHVRALIWEPSFAKMLSSIFFLENASQIDFSIPEEIVPQPYQRKRSQKPASGNERPSKPGVQGACPRPSFSPFLGRNGDPAGQAGPRGAAPRGLVIAPTTRRVSSTGGPRPPAPPTDGNGFTLWQQTQNTSPTGGGYLDPNPLSQGA